MPHFSIEYSANLEARHDMHALANLIAQSAEKTGVFPLSGIRVRLYPSRTVSIADGHPDNAFVAILARIGAGRDGETKAEAGRQIFEAVQEFMADEVAGGHFLLSFDMIENDPQTSFKLNTVRSRLGA